MNKAEIITYAGVVIMMLFLVMAFVIGDIIASKLMTSFGIISGGFSSYQFSKSIKQ